MVAELDRILRSFRAIVREVFPNLEYLGTYEYIVEGQTGALLELRPHPAIASKMPILSGVYAYPGAAGYRSDLNTGARVLVSFVNGDPARPIVTGFTSDNDSDYKPKKIQLDTDGTDDIQLNGGTQKVARVGDSVAVATFEFIPGTGGASLKINGSAITLPTAITGSISGPGADHVKA